jgi:hypothetical protein
MPLPFHSSNRLGTRRRPGIVRPGPQSTRKLPESEGKILERRTSPQAAAHGPPRSRYSPRVSAAPSNERPTSLDPEFRARPRGRDRAHAPRCGEDRLPRRGVRSRRAAGAHPHRLRCRDRRDARRDRARSSRARAWSGPRSASCSSTRARASTGKGRTTEVATFRTDIGYGDKRRPDRVEFTDAEHDAQRRDFTINALFLDPLETDACRATAGAVPGRAGSSTMWTAGGIWRPGSCARWGSPAGASTRTTSARSGPSGSPAGSGSTSTPRPRTRSARTRASCTGVSKERVGEELRKMLAHPAGREAVRMIDDLGLDTPTLGKANRIRFRAGTWAGIWRGFCTGRDGSRRDPTTCSRGSMPTPRSRSRSRRSRSSGTGVIRRGWGGGRDRALAVGALPEQRGARRVRADPGDADPAADGLVRRARRAAEADRNGAVLPGCPPPADRRRSAARRAGHGPARRARAHRDGPRSPAPCSTGMP